MKMLYSNFGTMHKVIVHLNGWQHRCTRRACTLSNVHTVSDYMQTWMMRYKGALLHLPKMMNPIVVELKACIQSQIQNYEELLQLITSLQASHACVFKSMDVILCAHVIPSIRTLTEVKTKAQV